MDHLSISPLTHLNDTVSQGLLKDVGDEPATLLKNNDDVDGHSPQVKGERRRHAHTLFRSYDDGGGDDDWLMIDRWLIDDWLMMIIMMVRRNRRRMLIVIVAIKIWMVIKVIWMRASETRPLVNSSLRVFFHILNSQFPQHPLSQETTSTTTQTRKPLKSQNFSTSPPPMPPQKRILIIFKEVSLHGWSLLFSKLIMYLWYKAWRKAPLCQLSDDSRKLSCSSTTS